MAKGRKRGRTAGAKAGGAGKRTAGRSSATKSVRKPAAAAKAARKAAAKPVGKTLRAKPAAKTTVSRIGVVKPGRKAGAGAVARATARRPVKENPFVVRAALPRPAPKHQSPKSIYDRDLDRNPANYQPLTPLQFIERTASVFPDQLAVVHGARRYTWRQTYARCRLLASALVQQGIGIGDTVAIMAPNIPEMYEAHFGVPMTGAVLNALNTRLDAAMIAFILDHSETRILLVDREFQAVVQAALAQMKSRPLVVDIADSEFDGGGPIGEFEYESFIGAGDPDFAWSYPTDEWNAISLCYTSGTTGNPKGVVAHHRGATLAAYGNAVQWPLQPHPRYLWTLPMFHCNGWCFPWTLALMAGTSVCLRRISAKTIYDALVEHDVTNLCGAPIILNFLINATEHERQPLSRTVEFMTAAAPPPAAVLEAVERQGFHITHVYGLTEVYGPATVCDWNEAWNALPSDEQARLKARQGVRYAVEDAVTVMDPRTMTEVAADGETMGEVMFRGNLVMKGYLKNPAATEDAFAGGWFHSGDLGVLHPDRYIELRDRSKDIIISGGENISTIEVEGVLYSHPAVLEAAVVARPDEKWGETPCAFVVLKQGTAASAEEIIAFCRQHMAGYKIPRTVVFRELPKTSTGKVQKFVLRDWARSL